MTPGRLDSNLIACWKRPDSFAGRGEDRVAKRRQKRRHSWLSDSTRRHVGAVRNDVNTHIYRCIVDASHRIVVKITLLGGAILEGNLTDEIAEPHDGCPFNLGTNPLGIDSKTAVNRGLDARDGQLSSRVHANFDDRCDVRQEAAVCCNSEPASLRQRSPPAGTRGRQVDDVRETSGVDRIGRIRITIIPERIGQPQFLELDFSRRPNNFKQEVFGIPAQLERDLCNEGLYGERVR